MKRTIAATALALGAVLTLAACGGDDTTSSSGSSGSSSSSSSSGTTPSGSATPAAGEHNQADVMFAQGMIPHHAQAIEMSDLLLAKDGVDPAVVELARNIKSAQTPEMEQMTGWLVGWDEDVPTGSMGGGDMGGMDMSGMMSEEDMTALKDASGADASRLFLEQMVVHHRSAVMMAEIELKTGRNGDTKALAEQIIKSQTSEITTMTELLGS